ncbi:MAG: NADH-quinone oxidoreductase subunit C [Methanomicrobiales archaeon]
MTDESYTAEEICDRLEKALSGRVRDTTVTRRGEGVQKTPLSAIWMTIDRDDLKEAIQALIDIDYPHLSVISGVDEGEQVTLNYHLTILFGARNREIPVTFSVPLPKDDLTVPTISDLIPGAVYTEREKQEMLGVAVTGIPDARRLFLPPSFPEGVHPWRKDDAGIPVEMVRELWREGRPTDRPAPLVPEETEPTGDDDA